MSGLDAITRANRALDRIEYSLAVYVAMFEFAAKGHRYDA
jgi:hypothetical protein